MGDTNASATSASNDEPTLVQKFLGLNTSVSIDTVVDKIGE